MGRTRLDGRSKNGSDNQSASVYLYKGIGDMTDSQYDNVFSDVADSYEKIYNQSSQIPGFEVIQYDCTFDRTEGSYADMNMINAWDQWLSDNGIDSNGFHCLLHDQKSDVTGTNGGNRGWDEVAHSFYRYYGDPNTAYLASGVLHESFHSNIEQSEVEDLIDTTISDPTIHDLGIKWDKSANGISYTAESPLANDAADERGDCSQARDHDTWTWDPTSCTITGLERTHELVFG